MEASSLAMPIVAANLFCISMKFNALESPTEFPRRCLGEFYLRGFSIPSSWEYEDRRWDASFRGVILKIAYKWLSVSDLAW